ncbi:dapper homolog 3-like [Phyllostomus discolor]|uniref:Dapper homolog 3-like n=1 Tax=Phyllostomus discolor TaxID=89673 RepID=A0A7E6EH89_9CHIR|nr:dapper homolog 3-like [Phyllostomus discolor]
MPGAPSGLRGPAPPRSRLGSRPALSGSPRWRGRLLFTSAPEENKRKNKVFPLPPSCLFFFPRPPSGFRLPDVSVCPQRRRAPGGPGPARGRTHAACGLQPLPPGRPPRGLGRGDSRAGGGASVARGQALQERLGAAPAAGEGEKGRGPRQGGPFALSTQRRRRPLELAALGRALHLRGQPGCAASAAARAPCTRARDRAGRGGGSPSEGARRGSWAPSLPSAARLSAAQKVQGPGGALDQEEKVEGRRCGVAGFPERDRQGLQFQFGFA